MTGKQNALVTGSTKGIGRAISLRLAQNYHLLLNYHSDDDAAQETANLIKKEGGSCELLKFDVSQGDSVKKSLEPLIESGKEIDVLVNNAGITADNAMVWMPMQEWDKVLKTNLYSFFHLTKIVIKGMITRRRGRVISIASTSGQTGVRGQSNYAASKGGLIAASKSLAMEVAKRGITVNIVAPGFIDTEMLKGINKKEACKLIPMKRFGKPEEVASAVFFLASEESGYITGQVLAVNGGIYM